PPPPLFFFNPQPPNRHFLMCLEFPRVLFPSPPPKKNKKKKKKKEIIEIPERAEGRGVGKECGGTGS
uniref:hypothetical protein n=1 Tax=Streptococcus agalactiae TaxID=1311 RepID=UPI001A7EE98A